MVSGTCLVLDLANLHHYAFHPKRAVPLPRYRFTGPLERQSTTGLLRYISPCKEFIGPIAFSVYDNTSIPNPLPPYARIHLNACGKRRCGMGSRARGRGSSLEAAVWYSSEGVGDAMREMIGLSCRGLVHMGVCSAFVPAGSGYFGLYGSGLETFKTCIVEALVGYMNHDR